jgi:16S rRNA (uracil1498-N3)-methyltransferase
LECMTREHSRRRLCSLFYVRDTTALAHVYRFYCEHLGDGTSPIRLDGAEAHHALHVVRVNAGDSIACFDGRGREAVGVVSAVQRSAVVIEPESVVASPPLSYDLTVAVACLHREKSLEELIRRGTEIGVTRFLFFRGDHSERSPKASDKWARWAVESCKQCGRAWLPEFNVVKDLGVVLDDVDGVVLIATQHLAPVSLATAMRGNSTTIVIGPEGDFSGDELAMAESRSAKPVSLGANTFRSEVAATVLATLVLYEMGGLQPDA